MEGGGWNFLDLRGAQFRVFTPPALQPEGGKHPTLFAGDRHVARVPTQPNPKATRPITAVR